MKRRSRAVVLTLMGAGTIAYFSPGCSRSDDGDAPPTTRASHGTGGHVFVGRPFVGGGSGGGSTSSSGVTRGGFGHSAPGHVAS